VDGRSNGAISSSNKSKMAAAAILEKFQMAISTQPVVRSTSCYRVGFSGTADPMALFSIRINSRWRPPPSWIISIGLISATARGLRTTLYSAHRAVIFAIAQLSCIDLTSTERRPKCVCDSSYYRGLCESRLK